VCYDNRHLQGHWWRILLHHHITGFCRNGVVFKSDLQYEMLWMDEATTLSCRLHDKKGDLAIGSLPLPSKKCEDILSRTLKRVWVVMDGIVV